MRRAKMPTETEVQQKISRMFHEDTKRLQIWTKTYFSKLLVFQADPSDRAVSGVGLRPIACWDCGFESRRGQGCPSLVNVVFCQVKVSASD
jgi:hypothetical protein